MRDVIILFAKAPKPGCVKTRLVPPLTHTEAARLHEAFVSDMLARFQQLTTVDIELHIDASTDAWNLPGVTRKLQIPGGLGLKMFHTLHSALASGYRRAAIVGTDSPTVPLESVESLMHSDSDVTLAPTDDGGFWAISASQTNPHMFDGVTWSRSDTLEQTIASIKRSGLSVDLGPRWFDIDEPADLDRLFAKAVPPATQKWAEEYRPLIAARIASS